MSFAGSCQLILEEYAERLTRRHTFSRVETPRQNPSMRLFLFPASETALFTRSRGLRGLDRRENTGRRRMSHKILQELQVFLKVCLCVSGEEQAGCRVTAPELFFLPAH